MSVSDNNNPLLQDIKAVMKTFIPTGSNAMNTFRMTDKVRHDVINTLILLADNIPHPASGIDSIGDGAGVAVSIHTQSINCSKTSSKTMQRWQILAYLSGIDLAIAKWFESHLDALSILHEVDRLAGNKDKPAKGLWAVWAAEGHPNPITYHQGRITGTKGWCSGANIVANSLITYRDDDGHSQLITVNMPQNGIEIENEEWQAIGMQATDTATVHFNQVTASKVGTPNAYLDRVGFWHGAAGVAACWYGATASLASYLMKSYQQKPNDYKAMYLGQISTALAVSQQYFNHVAYLIDNQPTLSHELIIRQLRSNVEQLARLVIDNVGQALGATPFCRNAHFARLSADLPVFIRQSHGAFDLQKIGELSSDLTGSLNNQSNSEQESLWQL